MHVNIWPCVRSWAYDSLGGPVCLLGGKGSGLVTIPLLASGRPRLGGGWGVGGGSGGGSGGGWTCSNVIRGGGGGGRRGIRGVTWSSS